MGLPIFQISLKICREISTAHSNNPNPRDLGVGDQKNAATEQFTACLCPNTLVLLHPVRSLPLWTITNFPQCVGVGQVTNPVC